MKNSALLFGAGTYGSVYAAYLNKKYNVLGYLDDNSALWGTQIAQLPVFGGIKELITNTVLSQTHVFVPIGNNKVRVKILAELNKLSFETPSFVHESCQLHESVVYGQQFYMLASSNIMPYTQIGDAVMISMGVNVAHHCVLGNGVFLSQGVNVGASIEIGDHAFVGIGATLKTGIKRIGKGAVIGAGAVVIQDVPDYAVVVGNPARILKYNDPKSV